MPLYRVNGKITKGSRLAKRERSARHRHERVAQNGKAHMKGLQSWGIRPTEFARLLDSYLQNRRLQLHNYHMRQNRRWLTAKIHAEGNDDIPPHVRWPLMQHWTKTEHHQQNPKLSDGLALTDDVKAALDLLRDERAIAAVQQGNPERVADWWVQPEIKSKKKGKKGKNAKRHGAIAARSVSVEGLGDDVRDLGLSDGGEEVEAEEMSPSLEEGFRGSHSPVVLSPEGSVVSDGDEEDEE